LKFLERVVRIVYRSKLDVADDARKRLRDLLSELVR
jgi:hypothetical protein